MTTTFTIPSCKINQFVDIAAKIAKKQVKYSLPVIDFREIGKVVIQREYRCHEKGTSYSDDRVSKIDVEYTRFEVENAGAVRKDNADSYKHVGSISMKDGIMIANCPDDSYAEWFGEYPAVCDHCGTVRKRNSYHVFEKDGRQYNIGSTCVKDYFGFDCASLLNLDIELFSLVNYDEDDIFMHKGYFTVSFSKIYEFFRTHAISKWDEMKEEIKSTEDWTKMPRYNGDLTEIYEQVKHHYDNYEGNTFRQNCHNVLQYNYTTMKNLVLYACAVFFALKDIEKSKCAGNETLNKAYKQGERILLEAKINKISTFTREMYFGWKPTYETVTILKMTDNEGERYETFTSGRIADCVREGDTIRLKGTVEGKKAYKGIESWSLKRCSLVK